MRAQYKGLLLDLIVQLKDGRITMKEIRVYLSRKEFKDFTALYLAK